MHFQTVANVMRGFGVAAIVISLVSPSLSPASDSAASPPLLYNQGTQKFREGKLREAEASLQTALVSQDEKVQIPALYNLGHVRFTEGAEELKAGPNSKASDAAAKRACADGDGALQAADYALSGWDVDAIAAAYMQGRGARKELKAATQAVRQALETYGAVLAKWQRASGDFKSAHELQASDLDAQANAEVVDRSIARLVENRRASRSCSSESRFTDMHRLREIRLYVSPWILMDASTRGGASASEHTAVAVRPLRFP